MDALFLYDVNDIPSNSKVLLYGAGDGGSAFKRILEAKRKDVEIICFVDDCRTGKRDGLRIVRPDELGSFRNTYDRILITSAYWREMRETLDRLHIDTYETIHPFLFYEYMIFTDAQVKKYFSRIKKAEAVFDSADDRRLYRYVIDNRRMVPDDSLRGYFTSRPHGKDAQYLEYVNRNTIRVIIEGGVLEGANTLEFARLLPKDGFLYGFEPLYGSLENGCKKRLQELTNVKVYPIALWEQKGKLPFYENADNRDGSRVVDCDYWIPGVKTVDAISIDEFAQENGISRVDFIKLDVEGSELRVLRGAAETLIRHRPQVAVSIYHTKEDLFEIPLFLKSLLKRYRYKLGHYSSAFWDTVLYALPEEVLSKG